MIRLNSPGNGLRVWSFFFLAFISADALPKMCRPCWTGTRVMMIRIRSVMEMESANGSSRNSVLNIFSSRVGVWIRLLTSQLQGYEASWLGLVWFGSGNTNNCSYDGQWTMDNGQWGIWVMSGRLGMMPDGRYTVNHGWWFGVLCIQAQPWFPLRLGMRNASITHSFWMSFLGSYGVQLIL